MKKYTVFVKLESCVYIDVEAETEADAIEIAEDECLNGDWNAMECPECSSQIVDTADIEPETEQETKPMLTDVHCFYTGGGIWVYKAKYGPLWMYGSLDDAISAYDDDPEGTDFFDYNAHYVHLTFLAPTWQDIADSLKQPESHVESNVEDPYNALLRWNGDRMDRPCTEQ